MYNFKIYKDGEIIKSFDNQETDIEPFKWMLNHQSSSISHALKYEGYSVEQINLDCGTSTFWTP